MRNWIPLFVVATMVLVGCQAQSPTAETPATRAAPAESTTTATSEMPPAQESTTEKAVESATTPPPAEAGQVIQTAQIKITGMDCAGCVKQTQTALAKVEGFKELRADPAKQEGFVSFDPSKTDVEKLIVAINEGTKFKASKI